MAGQPSTRTFLSQVRRSSYKRKWDNHDDDDDGRKQGRSAAASDIPDESWRREEEYGNATWSVSALLSALGNRFRGCTYVCERIRTRARQADWYCRVCAARLTYWPNIIAMAIWLQDSAYSRSWLVFTRASLQDKFWGSRSASSSRDDTAGDSRDDSQLIATAARPSRVTIREFVYYAFFIWNLTRIIFPFDFYRFASKTAARPRVCFGDSIISSPLTFYYLDRIMWSIF